MANSKRFKQLIRRIAQIETQYIPAIRPTGDYSKKEQDDLRALLFLVHAELESYFEEVAEHKVKATFINWKSTKRKSNILIALPAFVETKSTDNSLENRLQGSFSGYMQILKDNNGIKEPNLLKILLPLGIEYHNIDSTWLGIMSSFGSKRGDVAHKTAAVQSPLDPLTIKNDIQLILAQITLLDESIHKLT